MKTWKKTLLCTAIAGGGLLAFAAPAAAYVYSLSHLDIAGLVITTGPTPATPTTYTFDLANTATYPSPGTIVATGNSCSGTFGGATTCGGPGAPLVLDAPPANGVSNTVNRTNNVFTFIGPTGNYAGSDNVIYDAELVGDPSTATEQIAESNLTSANSIARSNSEITSNTTITWTLEVSNTGSLSLRFNADPDQLVTITETSGGNSAQSNLITSFTLTQNTGGGSVSWSPQGTFGVAGSNDCVVVGLAGVTCVETADSQDLNSNPAVGSNPSTAQNSYDVAALLTAFGIDIANLPAGTYNLALSATTSTIVTRSVAVPEPISLALVGIGMLGMGLVARRRGKTV